MTSSIPFHQRVQDPSTPSLLKILYRIIEDKQSVLCVAADVTKMETFFNLIHNVGPHICMLKTHIDILEDFEPGYIAALQLLAERYNFLIFEDRKFADIGNTVACQYRDGIYHISSWAHFVNCHPIVGEGVVQGLHSVVVAQLDPSILRGCLFISDMSSDGWLGTDEYKNECLKISKKFPDFFCGWITGSRWNSQLPGVVCTPGISMTRKGDALGQTYKTPEQAILELDSDIIIVGRDVTQPESPLTSSEAAERYKKASWQAYQTKTMRNSAAMKPNF